MTSSFRTERDSMGELKVPAEALWGAQTQRAVQNFPISGVSMPREFIAALAGRPGANTRVSRTLGIEFHYAAAPTEFGAVRLAYPLASSTRIFRCRSIRPARAPAPT